MAAGPVDKKANTISMVVHGWTFPTDRFTPSHRINGYPWRLRLSDGKNSEMKLSLICDKSKEAELWICTALITAINYKSNVNKHVFKSWDKSSQEVTIWSMKVVTGSEIGVTIQTEEDGEKFHYPPNLDPLEPHNPLHYAAFVIGDGGRKIGVNKTFLATHSPYFDRLFNGDFKEKNMVEIPIGDVEYEEFSNIIRMLCGFAGASLTDKNVHRVMQLADRFQLKIVKDKVVFFLLTSSTLPLQQKLLISEQYDDMSMLKIVEDKVVSFVLSTSSRLPLQQKLLISEKYNFPFLKDTLLSQKYTVEQLKEVSKSPEWEELSKETIRVLYDMAFDRSE